MRRALEVAELIANAKSVRCRLSADSDHILKDELVNMAERMLRMKALLDKTLEEQGELLYSMKQERERAKPPASPN